MRKETGILVSYRIWRKTTPTTQRHLPTIPDCPTSVLFYEFIARDLYLRASDSPTRRRVRNDSRTPASSTFRMKVEIVFSRRILDGFTYLILLIVRYTCLFCYSIFFFLRGGRTLHKYWYFQERFEIRFN